MFTTEEISKLVDGKLEGDPTIEITTIKNIENANQGALSFIASEEYIKYLNTTSASAIIVPELLDLQPNEGKPILIKVSNVYEALTKLLKVIENMGIENNGISPLSYVSKTATLCDDVSVGAFSFISDNVQIGESTKIATQVFIGKNVKIGKSVKIYSGVKIYHECQIGDNCIIHANAVIGSDGFGFKPDDKGLFQKVPHVGIVIIENEVEIGANTVVDRATFGETIIRKGVKLDNLIQIGHNVEVGSNTVIAAQTGIAGSTKIGKNSMIGGQSGFAPHLKIADGSKFQAQSGVNKNIKTENGAYQGTPAIDFTNHMKSSVVFKNLPELQKKIFDLEKEILNLKKLLDESKNH